MHPMGAVVGVAVGLLLVGGAVGQGVEPEVVFEDVQVPQVVQPFGKPVATPVEVVVECLPHEQGTTFFTATFRDRTNGTPMDLLFTPASMTTMAFAGDCTAPGSTVAFNTTAQVALPAEGTRAFEPIEAGMEVMIEKGPPSGAGESYGPYTASITAMPGYFELYNVRVDEKLQRGGAGDTLGFPVILDNLSNGATRFTLTVTEQPEGITAQIEPANVTVPPAGSATVVVSTQGGGLVTGDSGELQVHIDLTPVAEQARDLPDNASTIRLTVDHGAQATPMPGAGALAAVLAGLAVLARRSRAR